MRLRLFLVLIALNVGACAAESPDRMFSSPVVYPQGQGATEARNPLSDRVNAIVSRLDAAANRICSAAESRQAAARVNAAAPGSERLESFGPTSREQSRPAQPIVAVNPANCTGIAVVVTSSASTFASTNGQRIQVARGFVEFAHNDSELAFVLAHEMAHILKGHRPVVDASVAFAQELEADRLGFQLLMRAGYESAGAIELLRRLQGSSSASGDQMHPSFSARADILEKERAQLVSSPAILASP